MGSLTGEYEEETWTLFTLFFLPVGTIKKK
jgi:hypothetical protein